jgi:hypothetical protein
MDPIKVRVHHETNIWQTQKNLVGTNKCECVDDLGWFPMTPRYRLLGLEAPEAQEWHLAFAHKFNTFHLVMGLCLSWWCFLLPGCKWGEWDSCPFHHRDPGTYAISGHVLIWSQRIYFYGCHVWHERCEIPFIYIDGIWVSLHKGVSCLGYHELANMWRFGGMVECPVDKTSLTYARLKTIMFHCGWCPTRIPNIAVGCTLIFNFLLHRY